MTRPKIHIAGFEPCTSCSDVLECPEAFTEIAEECGKAIELDAYRPHKVSELICVKCGKRFISCRPLGTKLKDMDCPNLKCQSRGFIIETGEVFDDDTL